MTPIADRRATLLIFDIDGTVIHPTRLEDAAFLLTIRAEFGIDKVDADWSGYRNVTDSGILAELLMRRGMQPPSAAQIHAFRSSYVARLGAALADNPAEGLPIPGAADFIQHLASSGWSVAFATGNWSEVARLKLRRAGIRHAGLPMAAADDAQAREALLRLAHERAAAQSGRTVDSVVAIGDAIWDARAAAALRIPFVGVGAHWHEPTGWPCVGHFVDYSDADRVLALLAGAAAGE